MNPRETVARVAEAMLPGVLLWGGFLAVLLRKPDQRIYSVPRGDQVREIT